MHPAAADGIGSPVTVMTEAILASARSASVALALTSKLMHTKLETTLIRSQSQCVCVEIKLQARVKVHAASSFRRMAQKRVKAKRRNELSCWHEARRLIKQEGPQPRVRPPMQSWRQGR